MWRPKMGDRQIFDCVWFSPPTWTYIHTIELIPFADSFNVPVTVYCSHVLHAAHYLASHFVSSVVAVCAARQFAMCPCHSLHMHTVRGTFRQLRQSGPTAVRRGWHVTSFHLSTWRRYCAMYFSLEQVQVRKVMCCAGREVIPVSSCKAI